MRISDWSSDVCAYDLASSALSAFCFTVAVIWCIEAAVSSRLAACCSVRLARSLLPDEISDAASRTIPAAPLTCPMVSASCWLVWLAFCFSRRSEEHTSELQSLMRISYAVFCLTNKKHKNQVTNH